MIQTRDLGAFVQVMRLKSVSLAAAHPKVTQSAVSRRLASLEAQLGRKLFEPDGRGIKATPHALAFAAEATRVHRDLRALHQNSRGSHQRPVTLHLAATAQTIEAVLVPVIENLDPMQLTLELSEAGGGEVLSQVLAGVVDAGVTTNPSIGAEVMSHHIGVLNLRVFGKPDLVSPSSRRLDISHLIDRSILCLDTSFKSRRLLDAAFQLFGTTPKIAYEGRSTRDVLALAKIGFGVAVLPSNVVTDMPYRVLETRGDALTLDQTLVWGSRPEALFGISHLRAALTEMGK